MYMIHKFMIIYTIAITLIKIGLHKLHLIFFRITEYNQN